MERFISCPNIPKCRVSLGIVDGRAGISLIEGLEKLGVRLIKAGRCMDLYDSVSHHPDMYIHHLGLGRIVAAPNAPDDLIRELESNGFHIQTGCKKVSASYPGDIAYNTARIGKYAICNYNNTDKILLDYLEDMGVKIVDVRQGYAKCSICIVDDNSVITSDDGIARTLAGLGMEVLKISPGNIILPGLDYGFIGGASGMVSGDIIVFFGNLASHPDFRKIQDFVKSHGKGCMSLSHESLTDLGTFIPLKEYCIEEIC